MNGISTTLESRLQEGECVIIHTVGSSMKPLLVQRQTHVRVLPTSPESCNKGDILLYKRADGTLVLHRLVKTAASRYITRGDNTYYDESIRGSQILGKVDMIYKNGKQISAHDPKYIAYVFFRTNSYPLRRLYKKVRRMAGKIIKGR